jgi:hypothetical protein
MPKNAPAHPAASEGAPAEGTPAEGAPAGDPLEAKIERILAQFKDLVPPEDLAFMRDMMRLAADTHPDMVTLVDRLRNQAPVARSTVRARSGAGPRAQTTAPAERSEVGRSPTHTKRQKKGPR